MKKLAIALILVLATAGAHAEQITITVDGRVYDSFDGSNFFALGAGEGTIVGATVTAVYMFDTDEVPADLYPAASHLVQYRDETDWVSATTTIDPSTVGPTSISDETVADADSYYDYLHVQDDAVAGISNYELIILQSVNEDRSASESVTQYIYFDRRGGNNISSVDVDAVLDVDPLLWYIAVGSVSYYSPNHSAWAAYSVTSVTTSSVSVPASTVLKLLLILKSKNSDAASKR